MTKPLAISPQRALTGWAYGVGPAAIVVRCTPAAALDEPADAALEQQLQEWVRPLLPRPGAAGDETVAQALLYWTGAIQNRCGLDVFRIGRPLRAAGGAAELDLVVPHAAGRPITVLRVLQWLAAAFMERRPIEPASLQRLLDEVRQAAVKGKNTMQFLRAAEAAGLPWTRVADNYYQFGWGSRSRLMQSTFSDRTPVLGANLARDKRLTAIVLQRAGLPVPAHAPAESAEQAVRVAARLGYPVVVKPADLDGGVGVAAGLLDADSVRRSYARAAKHSRKILVEKHAAGQDYRLMTFDGELVWAILRLPAAVTGDGLASVEELVRQCNLDPRRGTAHESPLRSLVLDDEALELLAEQGLDPSAVPQAGRFVRLRRIANMNRGGTALPVNDQVHPDNRALALQAAEALGLDLAGIDLIMDDISRSWRETGAAICEVNAQPQMGGNLQKHVHGQILRALVPEGGRIPLLVVVGRDAPQAAACVDAVVRRLARRGLRVGLARACGAWLDGVPLGWHRQLHGAVETLLAHRRTDVLVTWIEDDAALAGGLPFDRADLLLLLSPPAGRTPLPALIDWLAPSPDCRWLVDGDDADSAAAARAAATAAQMLPGSGPEVAERCAEAAERALFGA